MRLASRRIVSRAAALIAFAALAIPAQAQLDGFQNLLGPAADGGKPAAEPKIEAKLTPADAQPGDVVTLAITARIPEGSYTYSTTRSADLGGSPTRVQVDDAAGLEPVEDEFSPDRPPKKELDPTFGKQVEKYKEDVTWTRKFRIKPDADPEQVRVTGKVRYQVCDDRACRMPKGDFQASLRDSGSRIPDDALTFKAAPEVSGKPGPATVRAGLIPKDAKPGDKVTLAIRLSFDGGWHTYSVTQKPGNAAQATAIKVTESQGLKPAGENFEPADAPEIKTIDLPNDKLVQEVHKREVTWTREFEVTDAEYGVSGTIRYQVCDAARCLQPKTVAFQVGAEQMQQAAAAAPSRGGPAAEAQESTVPAAETEAKEAEADESGETVAATAAGGVDRSKGLIPFIIAAAIAGFAALLTPCVFPMIPITVSFFLKQSEREHHRPVGMALIYCAGIIFTFTGLGMLMSILFSATALNRLSNDPWLNLAIAGVLIFFGCNLLGMFEIRMPNSLLTWSSNKEGEGGVVGTLFMALTFTLVSFTCTFAFLGGLLVWAANGEFFWPIVGMLAFSAAFSLPFFFLALFPSFLKKLPKSGGWMNTVKVTMGLIEVGAAFKFLSVADLSWNPTPLIFDYSLVMTAWIIISIVTGLYLLGLFRLPHDTPVQSISVPRLLFALMFLGLAGYVSVGVFSAKRPDGIIWGKIHAFAPGSFEGGEAADLGPVLVHDGLPYALDYEMALNVARQSGQPVFLDFTGVNCVNCREMEARLAEPALRERLEKFVRVQLYADNVPTITDPARAESLLEKNLALQETWFGDVTLPSYAVITPDKELLASVKGQQSVDIFARFLDEGLTKWQQVARGERVPSSTVAAALP